MSDQAPPNVSPTADLDTLISEIGTTYPLLSVVGLPETEAYAEYDENDALDAVICAGLVHA